MFSCGSGSTFALAILDHERKFDMTEEEAIALCIKAIRHATFLDAYSGGFMLQPHQKKRLQDHMPEPTRVSWIRLSLRRITDSTRFYGPRKAR
ncbi:MAG: hypothetical protein CFE26_15925 [Verrucomicrobiales bacterium VVV1]|nr:MAG: hypothetical protein CFE26_15925 [Verrucomicrobiales bacterium VVV1]